LVAGDAGDATLEIVEAGDVAPAGLRRGRWFRAVRGRVVAETVL
jgi:hypothetical protein